MPESKKTVEKTGATLSFHWRYIMLPVIILFLSVVIAVYFYRLLPAEVAYHFKTGSPDRWLSRGTLLLWMLLPQLFLTLVPGVILWGITRLAALLPQLGSIQVKPGSSMLSLMGNMFALPQVILCFAMLNIFSYNSYQVHLLPLWVFTLIVMGVGAVILGIFFVRAIRQVWAANR